MEINGKIRRADKLPDDTAVLESIEHGANERIGELLSFVSRLMRIEGNYSIFIDGEWGSGKTFFVKQATMIMLSTLHELSGSKISGETRQCVQNKIASCGNLQLDNHSTCYPIYFNAWEFDYANEPLEPLVSCLINEFSAFDNLPKEQKSATSILTEIASSLTLSLGFVQLDVGKAKEALSEQDYLDAFNRKQTIRQKLIEAFTAARYERCDRFVLFVDELDRCRPEYAIKVLEALKFVFDTNDLTVVFSVNSQALGKSISSWYGNGFDGSRYLKRFHDEVYAIKSIDIPHYLSSFNLNVGYQSYLVTAAESHGITLRDLNRCIDYFSKLQSNNLLEVSLYYVFNGSPLTPSQQFYRIVNGAFAIGLILLFSVQDPSTKESVLSGRNYQAVEEWFLGDYDFCEALYRLDVDNPNGILPTSDIERYSQGRFRTTLMDIYGLSFGPQDHVSTIELEYASSSDVYRIRSLIRQTFDLNFRE